MTLSSLSSRDRRALSIAAYVLIPSLLFVFAVKPFFGSISTIKEQIEDEKSMLKRERGIAGKLPLLPEEKERASEQLRQEAARLFVGEDELVATGHLAEYITQLADQHGVTLQQSETRPGMQVAAGVRALQVEVRAEGDVYAVLNFLQDLETGEKLIRISNLTLEKSTRLPSFPTPQQPQVQPQNVQPMPQQQGGRRGWGGQRGGNRAGMQSVQTNIGGGATSIGMSTSIGVSGGVQAGQGNQGSAAAREAAMAQYRAAMAAQQQAIARQQGQRPGMPNPYAVPQQPPQPVEVLSLTASVHGYRLDGVPFNMDGVDVGGAPSPFDRQISGLASLDQVIDRNPFDPSRRAPNTNRFTGGGGGGGYEQPALRLSGTGISENYSFALISMGGDPKSQVVPVGGNVFGYTLMDVTSQTAVLKTPTGGTMVLRTAPPGTYASSGPVQSIGGLPPGMGRSMGMPPVPDMSNMTPQQREQAAREFSEQLGKMIGGDSSVEVKMDMGPPAPAPPPPPPSPASGTKGQGSNITTKPKKSEQTPSKSDAKAAKQSNTISK